MKLKFLSRAANMVSWPGPKSTGQLPRYVGRTYIPSDRPGVAGVFKADSEPSEIDSENHDAPQLVRQCAKGGLWAADQQTASACGVPFQALQQGPDGEWITKAAQPARADKKAES
jgi:hypothetical protein